MITRDNLSEVINSLDAKTKQRINNSDKEYCVLELHIFNVGGYCTAKLTNDYNRYANVSDKGNCILLTDEVIDILNN